MAESQVGTQNCRSFKPAVTETGLIWNESMSGWVTLGRAYGTFGSLTFRAFGDNLATDVLPCG
jgi:hypothetical protein